MDIMETGRVPPDHSRSYGSTPDTKPARERDRSHLSETTLHLHHPQPNVVGGFES